MSEAPISSKRKLLKNFAMFSLAVSAAGLAHAFGALDRTATRVRVPEKSFLQSAAMAGKKRVVAVGERGIVLLSDDRGQTWRQAKEVPVSVTLTAVSFVNELAGWAVGHGGVILQTIDGGETWSMQADGRALAKLAELSATELLQTNPDSELAKRELKAAQLLLSDGPDKPLLDVHFKDSLNGWVVGAYNLFFETSDGGRTWRSAMARLDNPRAMHLYAIRVHGTQVFVAGEQGLLHRSDDGGVSFKALGSPYKGTWFSLAIAPQGMVIAGLRGNAFFSRDQGNTWSAITGAPPVSFVASAVLRDGTVLLANQAGQLWSTDGGQPFQLTESPVMPMVSGLLDIGSDGLLITGANGVLRAPLNTQTKAVK